MSGGTGRKPRKSRAKLSPFGERLREAIAQSGFSSREDFIEASCVDPVTLWRYETGRAAPPPEFMMLAASMLGVESVTLLNADGSLPASLVDFLNTNTVTPEEAYLLQSIRTADAEPPDYNFYLMVLTGYRARKTKDR